MTSNRLNKEPEIHLSIRIYGEGGDERRGSWEGISRFARIWAQISNAHNSKTVWYSLPTKSATGYPLE